MYIVDTDTKEVRWFDFMKNGNADSRYGEYDLVRKFKDSLIVSFSAFDSPTALYLINFKNC